MSEQAYAYDAFISHSPTDRDWVQRRLLPRLQEAGLRVANADEQPGMPRILGIEQAIIQSKRTVIVLSPSYLSDNWAEFANVLAQTTDVEEGTYRLLPVQIVSLDPGQLPMRLRMLAPLDLTQPDRVEHAFVRLVRTLKRPLPRRVGQAKPPAAPTAARRSRAELPAKCPCCGAPLRPDEVRWFDGTTAACAYCRSVVHAAE